VFVMMSLPLANFGDVLHSIVADSQRRFLEFAAPDAAKRRKRSRSGAPRGGGGGGGAQKDDASQAMMRFTGGDSTDGMGFGATLEAGEKYALISGMEVYARAVDSMLDRTNLSSASVLRRVRLPVSERAPFVQNPAHPARSLTPFCVFAVLGSAVCAAQRDLRNYNTLRRTAAQLLQAGVAETALSGAPPPADVAWCFARPNCVLELEERHQLPARLAAMYLPAHQARNTSYSLSFDRLHRMRLASAHAAANFSQRLAQRRHEQAAAGGGGGGGDEDMTLEERALLEEELRGLERAIDEQGEHEDGGDGGGGEAVDVPQGQHLMSADGVRRLDELDRFDAGELEAESYEGVDTLASKSMLYPTDSPERSAFHAVRYAGAQRRDDLNALASGEGALPLGMAATRPMLREVYEELSRQQVVAYGEQCSMHISDISFTGKMLAGWYNARKEAGRPWLGVDAPLLDESLSLFGNWVAGMTNGIENNQFASSCHAEVLLLWLGSLDAYRHSFGDLHFAALLYGDNSTSKSFQLKCVQDMLVRKTVFEMGRQTKASQYTDDDHNDEITVSEEAPPEIMARDAKGGGAADQTAQMKEVMTKGERTCLTFCLSLSGRRMQRRVYSQHIKSYLFATNMTPEQIDAPMRSRMHEQHCMKHVRPGHMPSDMVGVLASLDARARGRAAAWRDSCHGRQYLHYVVEKLIGVSALSNVTTAAFDAVLCTFKNVLRDRFCLELHVRTIERMLLLVRACTVQHALHCLYSVPGASPHFRAPFALAQLLDIDPLLHDTEEMAYFVLRLCRTQLVPHERGIVLASLTQRCEGIRAAAAASMHEYAEAVRRCAAAGAPPAAHAAALTQLNEASREQMRHYLTADTLIVSGDSAAAGNAPFAGGGGAAPAAAAGERACDVLSIKPSQLCAYLHVHDRFGVLADNIANDTRSGGSTVLDAKAVKKALYAIKEQPILGKCYVWDRDAGCPRVKNEHDVAAMLLAIDERVQRNELTPERAHRARAAATQLHDQVRGVPPRGPACALRAPPLRGCRPTAPPPRLCASRAAATFHSAAVFSAALLRLFFAPLRRAARSCLQSSHAGGHGGRHAPRRCRRFSSMARAAAFLCTWTWCWSTRIRWKRPFGRVTRATARRCGG